MVRQFLHSFGFTVSSSSISSLVIPVFSLFVFIMLHIFWKTQVVDSVWLIFLTALAAFGAEGSGLKSRDAAWHCIYSSLS